MKSVRYSNNVLSMINKVGNLPKLSNGYYEFVLGAVNFKSRNGGAIYTLESAMKMLEASSSLIERVQDGRLRGENGHPQINFFDIKPEDFVRMNQILESRISVHYRDIHIEPDYVDNFGNRFPAFIGEGTPSGELGYVLEKSLANKDENIAFSVRSFTDNYYRNGQLYKDFVKIITWDIVNDPGLSVATKYGNASLESDNSVLINIERLERSIATPGIISVENMSAAKEYLAEVKHLIGRDERFKNRW